MEFTCVLRTPCNASSVPGVARWMSSIAVVKRQCYLSVRLGSAAVSGSLTMPALHSIWPPRPRDWNLAILLRAAVLCTGYFLTGSACFAAGDRSGSTSAVAMADQATETLLRKIEQQISDGRIISPPDDHAMQNWQLVMQSWQLVLQRDITAQRSPRGCCRGPGGLQIPTQGVRAVDEKAAGRVLEAAELIMFADQASFMLGSTAPVDPSVTVASAPDAEIDSVRPGQSDDGTSAPEDTLTAATARAKVAACRGGNQRQYWNPNQVALRRRPRLGICPAARRLASLPAPPATTTATQAAAPAKAPEAKQPETPVATLPAPSAVATTSPAVPIPPMPIAPPPAAALVPPPAAAPVTNVPPIASPPQRSAAGCRATAATFRHAASNGSAAHRPGEGCSGLRRHCRRR